LIPLCIIGHRCGVVELIQGANEGWLSSRGERNSRSLGY
jgi:hypothetical protein